jgi:hypothetical protein
LTLSRAEQETIVRFDRESEVMTVFTHSDSAVRKLKAAGAAVKYTSAEGQATCLEMPKGWFKWPRPKRKGGKGNPEALKKARENRNVGEKPQADSGK